MSLKITLIMALSNIQIKIISKKKILKNTYNNKFYGLLTDLIKFVRIIGLFIQPNKIKR